MGITIILYETFLLNVFQIKRFFYQCHRSSNILVVEKHSDKFSDCKYKDISRKYVWILWYLIFVAVFKPQELQEWQYELLQSFQVATAVLLLVLSGPIRAASYLVCILKAKSLIWSSI